MLSLFLPSPSVSLIILFPSSATHGVGVSRSFFHINQAQCTTHYPMNSTLLSPTLIFLLPQIIPTLQEKRRKNHHPNQPTTIILHPPAVVSSRYTHNPVSYFDAIIKRYIVPKPVAVLSSLSPHWQSNYSIHSGTCTLSRRHVH